MKNLNHLVALLQEGYTTVGVVFSTTPEQVRRSHHDEYPTSQRAPWQQEPQQASEKQYTYKCQFKDIKVGDLVILPPSSEGKLPSIGTVARVDGEPELNFESGIEYKWLVGVVDTKAYAEILEKEKKMMSVLREAEKVRQKKELLEAYQLELPSDPESRKLFDEARLIGGQIIEG
jgi:hypothetical protein